MTWERGHRAVAGVRTAAVAAVLCLSASALGQTSTGVMGQSSVGFHVGDGVLHPFVEGDARFDSLAGIKPGTTTPLADLVLHVRPGLKFDLLNASTSVNFNGSAEWLGYLGVFDASTRAFSRFQANVAADAAFNKDGAVEVQLGDSLSRSDRTQNPAAAVGVQSIYNNVRFALPIHPGGRALEITPSAGWGIEFFDCISASSSTIPGACSTTVAQSYNYSNVALGLNAKWKFLPKTALVVDVASDIRTYWNPAAVGALPSTLLRAQAGLMGLISTYFNVTLLAGYVHDFASVVPFNNVIGQAEVGYSPTEMIRVTLAYLRTAVPVPGGLRNYVDDRPSLKATIGLWAGRLTLTAGGAADLLNYYSVTPNRFDWIVSLNAGATVVVLPWMDVGALYNGSIRGTNAANSELLKLPRHEATLRLGLHY